jgi:hypothetical protein
VKVKVKVKAKVEVKVKALFVEEHVLVIKMLAGGQGFEPRLMEPESIVLPLDDPPTTTHCKFQIENFKLKNINTKFRIKKFGVRSLEFGVQNSNLELIISSKSALINGERVFA